MDKQISMTEAGLRKAEQELDNLKSVRRKEISEKIKVALGYGDLSENSEYDEAKNEQAIVEARIQELETLLKNVKVIDESELSTDQVHLGSKVTIKNMSDGATRTYQIVGSKEADPMNDMISDECPVGKSLLGHAVGDDVVIEIPSGEIIYQITEISK